MVLSSGFSKVRSERWAERCRLNETFLEALISSISIRESYIYRDAVKLEALMHWKSAFLRVKRVAEKGLAGHVAGRSPRLGLTRGRN